MSSHVKTPNIQGTPVTLQLKSTKSVQANNMNLIERTIFLPLSLALHHYGTLSTVIYMIMCDSHTVCISIDDFGYICMVPTFSQLIHYLLLRYGMLIQI